MQFHTPSHSIPPVDSLLFAFAFQCIVSPHCQTGNRTSAGNTQSQDEIWEFQVLSGTSGGKGGLHVKHLIHFVFVVLLAMMNLLTNLDLGCLVGFVLEIFAQRRCS